MASRVMACAIGVTLGAAGLSALAAPSEKLALVTVVADDTRAAAGLTPADFSLTENKKPAQVSEAIPARDPMSIVLVVDTGAPAGIATPTAELRRALTSFVATVLAAEPATKIAVYQVATAATPLADFTSDRAALDKAIGLVASGNPTGTPMLEGVVTAATRLGTMPAPRRAIVCVGMGTAEGSSYEPDDVGKRVRKSGATLWVVSVQGAGDQSLTSRDTVWKSVTADTGGLRQNSVQATRLDPQLKTVANSLLSQYMLKIIRQYEGAVMGFTGQTTSGAQVLFTHWMR
jgi:hypothetical protein